MKFSTKKMVTLGLLTAFSVVLVYLLHFPIFPSAPFLEYDPADIPIIIGTLAFGPIAGLALAFAASVIQGISVSAASGIIGIIMHFFATGSLVLVVGFIFNKKKTIPRAIISLAAGIVTMTVSMALWNILITPYFMNVPRSVVMPMILPIIVPFNLIKAGINSILAFIIYKALHKIL